MHMAKLAHVYNLEASSVEASKTVAVGTMATPGAHGGLSALKHTGDPGGA
jgi:hypothetical protein